MKPTIVIVEDDLIVAKVLQKILELEGFCVIINVVTVNQAIKVIEEHIPILVLIDINLQSEEDGIHLGHYLLKRKFIPYVYISSLYDAYTLNRVRETFPQGFISKPFKKIDVIETVLIAIKNFNPTYGNQFNNISISADVPFVFKHIVSYIDVNINKKITINDLVIRTRWKEKHFIRVFTDYMGATPYQFILLKKIEKAKKLIIETNIPTNAIAYELGFLSYTNFSNAFKKATGKTPSYYRLNFGLSLVN